MSEECGTGDIDCKDVFDSQGHLRYAKDTWNNLVFPSNACFHHEVFKITRKVFPNHVMFIVHGRHEHFTSISSSTLPFLQLITNCSFVRTDIITEIHYPAPRKQIEKKMRTQVVHWPIIHYGGNRPRS